MSHIYIYTYIYKWPLNISNGETLVKNSRLCRSTRHQSPANSQAAGAFSDIGHEVERRFAELSLEKKDNGGNASLITDVLCECLQHLSMYTIIICI